MNVRDLAAGRVAATSTTAGDRDCEIMWLEEIRTDRLQGATTDDPLRMAGAGVHGTGVAGDASARHARRDPLVRPVRGGREPGGGGRAGARGVGRELVTHAPPALPRLMRGKRPGAPRSTLTLSGFRSGI